MTIEVLKQKGESNRAIARRLGVVESVVRYHLKRNATGIKDGRSKLTLIEKLALTEVVRHWWQSQTEALPQGRSPNINGLWQFLKGEYDFTGSYKSVRKYVRATSVLLSSSSPMFHDFAMDVNSFQELVCIHRLRPVICQTVNDCVFCKQPAAFTNDLFSRDKTVVIPRSNCLNVSGKRKLM